MKRFTEQERTGCGHANLIAADVGCCINVCRENLCSSCPIQEAFDRLAAYEDTGLTPYQIVTYVRGNNNVY